MGSTFTQVATLVALFVVPLVLGGAVLLTIYAARHRQPDKRNLGFYASVTTVTWVVLAIPLQIAINLALDISGVAGQVVATIIWLAYVGGFVLSIALLLVWGVRSLLGRGSPRMSAEAVEQVVEEPVVNRPPSQSPKGWYPVTDGSGRVAWWDGEKWDESVAPPSQQQP